MGKFLSIQFLWECGLSLILYETEVIHVLISFQMHLIQCIIAIQKCRVLGINSETTMRWIFSVAINGFFALRYLVWPDRSLAIAKTHWKIKMYMYIIIILRSYLWISSSDFLFWFGRYEKKNDSKQKKVFIRNYLAWFGLSMIYFCRYDLLICTRTIHLSTIVFQKRLIYSQRMSNVVANERFRCVLYQCHKLFFSLILLTL